MKIRLWCIGSVFICRAYHDRSKVVLGVDDKADHAVVYLTRTEARRLAEQLRLFVQESKRQEREATNA